MFPLYLFGEITLNTRLLNFLVQKQVPVHVFNYYGYYSGSYYPREYLNSGFLLVNQVNHYNHRQKRLDLARSFVSGAFATLFLSAVSTILPASVEASDVRAPLELLRRARAGWPAAARRVQ